MIWIKPFSIAEFRPLGRFRRVQIQAWGGSAFRSGAQRGAVSRDCSPRKAFSGGSGFFGAVSHCSLGRRAESP